MNLREWTRKHGLKVENNNGSNMVYVDGNRDAVSDLYQCSDCKVSSQCGAVVYLSIKPVE